MAFVVRVSGARDQVYLLRLCVCVCVYMYVCMYVCTRMYYMALATESTCARRRMLAAVGACDT
jgi:hypothetical protein